MRSKVKRQIHSSPLHGSIQHAVGLAKKGNTTTPNAKRLATNDLHAPGCYRIPLTRKLRLGASEQYTISVFVFSVALSIFLLLLLFMSAARFRSLRLLVGGLALHERHLWDVEAWRLSRIHKLAGYLQLAVVVAVSVSLATVVGPPLLSFYLTTENALDRQGNPEFADAEKSKIDVDLGRVRQVLSDVDTLSIKELRSALVETSDFAKRLSAYVGKQESYIDGQKTRIAELQKAEEEARAKAAALAELREPQIKTLRELLTSDAREERRRGFIKGIWWSIPTSMLGSVIGPILPRALGDR